MRKIGAYLAIATLTAVILPTSPAAAFGLRIGPFHIGIPFLHHHRRLYMRASPRDDVSRESRSEPKGTVTSALLYPNLALSGIFQDIFFPGTTSSWPFGYEQIFSTAFARASTTADKRLCQPSVDGRAIVGRISNEIAPNDDQMQRLQKLGGALGAASGFLAKSCPDEVPAQPVARMQLMESQIEELAMAIDVIREPLQEFEQSLTDDQKAKFASVTPAVQTADARKQPESLGQACVEPPTAIDWSVDQIDRSVQPTAAQRPALNDAKQAFNKAAEDLQAHCPTAAPATPVARMEAIEARLDATWRSELAIQVALGNFESKLTDAQKDRFDRTDFAAR